MTVYAALWRALPGPAWARALQCVALVVVVVAVCFQWVFPWAEHWVPFADVTVGP